MERRTFIKTGSLLTVSAAAGTLSAKMQNTQQNTAKNFYEWQAYHLSGNASRLNSFFENVMIPFCSSKGITVGAFGSYSQEMPPVQYYLFVYPDAAAYLSFKENIWKDTDFNNSAKSYFAETAEKPIYRNIETTLCKGIDRVPKLIMPSKERSLFELRTYWSPTAEANQRKIHMFNNGEIDVFDDVKVNSVMYGEILAGPVMNAITYLTWYKDMAARDEAWGNFSKHPTWEKLRNMELYKNTATFNRRIFLVPLSYSQI